MGREGEAHKRVGAQKWKPTFVRLGLKKSLAEPDDFFHHKG
jgi:hypothetical protein